MKQKLGFILGTGWGKIVTELQNAKTESYEQLFNVKTSIPGHAGEAISGKLYGKDVIFMSGRFHTYEGHSTKEAVKTIEYLHDQGVTDVVITSASGALNPMYRVGDLVILSDLITLFCQSPLKGAQIQDMSAPFSQTLQKLAEKTAINQQIATQKGIYVYMKGPHFETYSDKMALRGLGADVVGMSTVHEVIMANYLQMNVLGLSMVTNLAFVKHSHEEVLKAAKSEEEKLKKFFGEFIKNL